MPWPVDPPKDLPAPPMSKFAARLKPVFQGDLTTGLPDNVALSILGTLLGENQARQIVKENQTTNPIEPGEQPTAEQPPPTTTE